jgi:flagellar biosynthesis/type III secretory pathway protein FliH
MDEGFTTLQDLLRSEASEYALEGPIDKPVEEPESDPAQPGASDAAADVRRFRAAVADAVAAAVDGLLCDIAAGVLARELELKPVDVRAVVARACLRHERERIVCVRAHPGEVDRLTDAGVDAVGDAQLRRGDVLLEVRTGTIDVTLGARLAAVLEGLSQ